MLSKQVHPRIVFSWGRPPETATNKKTVVFEVVFLAFVITFAYLYKHGKSVQQCWNQQINLCMKIRLTEKQIIEIVKKLHEYRKELDTEFPDSQNFKEVKTFKELLVEDKIEELIENLLKSEKTFRIETLVVENGNKSILLENRLLLEWEKYKKIPKTNLTYRYDPGQGKPGMEDHIHVYLGNAKNQVYAINKSGTPHDGSKAKLSNKEIKFLKSIGFEPPKGGILEWIKIYLPTIYIFPTKDFFCLNNKMGFYSYRFKILLNLV